VILNDIPYPRRLCVELLHYAIINCPHTGHMKCKDVKAAVAVFFDDEEVDAALAILAGKLPPNQKVDAMREPPEPPKCKFCGRLSPVEGRLWIDCGNGVSCGGPDCVAF